MKNNEAIRLILIIIIGLLLLFGFNTISQLKSQNPIETIEDTDYSALWHQYDCEARKGHIAEIKKQIVHMQAEVQRMEDSLQCGEKKENLE